jgi:hypothetical protein
MRSREQRRPSDFFFTSVRFLGSPSVRFLRWEFSHLSVRFFWSFGKKSDGRKKIGRKQKKRIRCLPVLVNASYRGIHIYSKHDFRVAPCRAAASDHS